MTHEVNTGGTWQVVLSLDHYTPRSGVVFFRDKDRKQYYVSMDNLQLHCQEKFGLHRVDKQKHKFLCTVEEHPNGKGPRIVSFDNMVD